MFPQHLDHLVRGGEKDDEEGEVASGLVVAVIVRLVESKAGDPGMTGMGSVIVS